MYSTEKKKSISFNLRRRVKAIMSMLQRKNSSPGLKPGQARKEFITYQSQVKSLIYSGYNQTVYFRIASLMTLHNPTLFFVSKELVGEVYLSIQRSSTLKSKEVQTTRLI